MRIRVAATGLIVGGMLALAGCGGEERSAEAYCDQLAEAEEAGVEEAFTGIEPDDIEGAREAFSDVANEFEELRDVAPEEIEGDVDTVLEGFDTIQAELDEAENAEDFQQRLLEAGPQLTEVQEATTRLDEFQTENCDNGGGEEEEEE